MTETFVEERCKERGRMAELIEECKKEKQDFVFVEEESKGHIGCWSSFLCMFKGRRHVISQDVVYAEKKKLEEAFEGVESDAKKVKQAVDHVEVKGREVTETETG